MKLLVDNNLPPRLAKALNIIVEVDGHSVTALRELFPENTKDIEWIEELGNDGGWTVVSLDMRITKRPAEKLAWRRSKLKGFFLAPGWASLGVEEKTARLLLWWPKLVQQEGLVGPGAIFEVPVKSGSKLKQLTI